MIFRWSRRKLSLRDFGIATGGVDDTPYLIFPSPVEHCPDWCAYRNHVFRLPKRVVRVTGEHGLVALHIVGYEPSDALCSWKAAETLEGLFEDRVHEEVRREGLTWLRRDTHLIRSVGHAITGN